jgi:hypothetical protein
VRDKDGSDVVRHVAAIEVAFAKGVPDEDVKIKPGGNADRRWILQQRTQDSRVVEQGIAGIVVRKKPSEGIVNHGRLSRGGVVRKIAGEEIWFGRRSGGIFGTIQHGPQERNVCGHQTGAAKRAHQIHNLNCVSAYAMPAGLASSANENCRGILAGFA